MNQVRKLEHERAALIQKGTQLLEAAKNEGRRLNDSERAAMHDIDARLDEVDKRLIEFARLAESDRLHPSVGLVTSLGTGARLAAKVNAARAKFPDRTFGAMFPGAGGIDGWGSFNEFLGALHSGLHHPNFRAGMTEGTGSAGGFLVPEEYVAQMLDASLESEIVRPRAKIEPMKSVTKKIAGWDAADNSGAAPFGGFSIQWLGEAGSATDRQGKTRMIELTANKAAIFTKASNELIADGISFEDMLAEALVQSLGWGLDHAFLTGTGAGKPLGVLNDPALITVTKEAGQAASTLLYENVVKMFARLHPGCYGSAVWVANPTVIPQLLIMQNRVKNAAATDFVGGSSVPVMTSADGKFTLLTLPILFTEKLPALTSKGDIILADFSQYSVGLRKEMSIEKSVHVGWQTDETGYRSIIRVDGQGRWSGPFTPKNGSTLSWCVTLEAR